MLNLTPEQATTRLAQDVAWGKFVFWELLDARSGELVGCRRGNVWTVARSIRYSNIYLPYVRFHLVTRANGSSVLLTSYAPWSIPLFLFCGLASFNAIEAIGFNMWIAFLVAMYTIGVLLFFWEKQKVLRQLRQILH